jgi:hypothetical protein
VAVRLGIHTGMVVVGEVGGGARQEQPAGKGVGAAGGDESEPAWEGFTPNNV